jgi:hypothetical protein
MASPTCVICLESDSLVQVHSDLCRCTIDPVMCLQCARRFYELNEPPAERQGKPCPICREFIETQYLNARKTYTKLTALWAVRQVPVECECGDVFVGALEHNNHINRFCPEAIVKCSAVFCEHRCKRALMDEHKAVCQVLNLRCYGCDEMVERHSLQHHKQHRCSGRTVVCPCCSSGLTARAMAGHAQEHIEQLVDFVGVL